MSRRLILATLVAILLFPSLMAVPALAGVGEVFDSIYVPERQAPAFVRVITDNVQAWYARWYILSNAKKSIDTTYFIVEDDVFGKAFVGLLLKKAKEGVPIRLMIDARGTKMLARAFLGQDYLQELMQQKGVTIKVYNPIHNALLNLPRDLREPIASNHDKLIICDDEWVITGGRNISSHYFADWKDQPKAYRDTDILMKGTQVTLQARKAFEDEFAYLSNTDIHKDWINFKSRDAELELNRRAMEQYMMGQGLADASGMPSDSSLLEGINEELSKFPAIQGYTGYMPYRGERPYPTFLLDKTSLVAEKNEITPNLIRFIDAAEKKIVIQNPYVVLTDLAKAALVRASGRGVPIYLLTNSPDSTDSLLTQALFVKDWKTTLKDIPTLRVFAYKGPAKIHAKVMVIDDEITVIGTYNMDPMSEQINGEDVAVVRASAFGVQNRLRIENDAKNSVEYKIKLGADGTPEQVVGPSDHVQPAALEAVQRVQMLSFLKPII
ncbi:MAG: phosphatidylserine/phosphatidylglycerophosphate/cardiolipin synthase family protein [Candidatus Wallbacteria bacterium]|nr:phosphatidylserine/phosphatidylglycerophosphate/cardiolipin synthase family protein [Candidatus Wallbacteria bacterium]